MSPPPRGSSATASSLSARRRRVLGAEAAWPQGQQSAGQRDLFSRGTKLLGSQLKNPFRFLLLFIYFLFFNPP